MVTGRNVTLIDGRDVDSASLEWRDECLARAILAMPFDRRRPWLENFEKRHGATTAEPIKALMARIHAARKPAIV